ncbi:DUF3857 domain-containing protein [Candidatus Eisenbacteria bacterium]|uniref:DUF3857 domain-containing protein n=1 Tax=Eiseniibacteriota bacterium TaxID=2212470 RepID=A0ABV6YNW8_UNCEI
MDRSGPAPIVCHLIAFFFAAAVLSVLLSSCGGRLKDVGGEDRFVEDVYWAEAEAHYQEYGGYYELKERKTLIEWESGQWGTTTDYHSVIVVLDAKKMEKYADFSIRLHPDSWISDLEAVTISADGQVTEVEETYERNTAPGFMLYSESNETVFAMPRFEDRCILEVKYRVHTSGPNLDDRFWFAAAIPVKKAAYSYIVSSTLTDMCDLKYKGYNFAIEAPQVMFYRTVNDVVHEFAWEVEDIEAVPYEDWMPPVEQYVPRIQLTGEVRSSPYSGWDRFAVWYYNVLKDYCVLPSELRDEMLALKSKLPGPVARMERIRDILAEDFRYVAIGLKDTHWKPHRPTEVCRNRYGDCKDLSTLAVCMLREAGFEACPALILTKDEGEIDRAVAVPRFNHMIVYIEDQDIWMDPTLGHVPLGMLHHSGRGVEALLIREESAVWKRTPVDPPFPSRRRLETLITLMSDGSVMGNSKATYEGDLALSRLRDYQGATDQEIDKSIRDAAQSYVSDASIQVCKLSRLEENPPKVTTVAQFSRPRTAFKLEDKMALRLDFLKPSLLQIAEEFEGAERRYDVSFPHVWSEIETVCIDIPSGWEVVDIPQPADSTGHWGSFHIDYSSVGNQVIVKRIYSLNRDKVDLSNLGRFTGFWREAKNLSSQEIVLKKQS